MDIVKHLLNSLDFRDERSGVTHAEQNSAEEKQEAGQEMAADYGQQVDIRFRAPRQGKYDLTLYIISGEMSQSVSPCHWKDSVTHQQETSPWRVSNPPT